MKCDITEERLDATVIRIRRQEIKCLVEECSSIHSIDLDGDECEWIDFESRLDVIYSKLIAYERKYRELKDAMTLLELALWKSRVDGSMQRKRSYAGQMKENNNLRKACHTNCGADVIIPYVLSLLLALLSPKPPPGAPPPMMLPSPMLPLVLLLRFDS